MTDLEQLSRDAAKVLPRHMWCRYWVDGEGQKLVPGECRFEGWLHESTEACAEIMVRVLWPAEVFLHTYKNSGVWMATPELKRIVTDTSDPMQAFRTAVLRALIEVKK